MKADAPRSVLGDANPSVCASGRRTVCLLLWRRAALVLILLTVVLFGLTALAASTHHGQVNFGGLPVPGATVTATKGDKRLGAVTDQQGVYTFTDLDDGVWAFQVEMFGFATQTQDIAISAGMPSPVWELKLLPFEEITRGLPATAAENSSAASPPASTGGRTPAAAAPRPQPSAKGVFRARRREFCWQRAAGPSASPSQRHKPNRK